MNGGSDRHWGTTGYWELWDLGVVMGGRLAGLSIWDEMDGEKKTTARLSSFLFTFFVFRPTPRGPEQAQV